MGQEADMNAQKMLNLEEKVNKNTESLTKIEELLVSKFKKWMSTILIQENLFEIF